MTKLDPKALYSAVTANGDRVVFGDYSYYYDTVSGNILRSPVDEVDLKWLGPFGEVRDSWRVVAATRAPEMPVYPHSETYAAVQNEVSQTSYNGLNYACSVAISQVIRANGDGYNLDADSVKLLEDNFGLDRTAFVLASSVRADAYASQEDKAWAEKELAARGVDLNDPLDRPTPDETRKYFTIDATTFEISALVSMVQDVQRERESERFARKPSIMAKLHTAKDEVAATDQSFPHAKKQDRER